MNGGDKAGVVKAPGRPDSLPKVVLTAPDIGSSSLTDFENGSPNQTPEQLRERLDTLSGSPSRQATAALALQRSRGNEFTRAALTRACPCESCSDCEAVAEHDSRPSPVPRSRDGPTPAENVSQRTIGDPAMQRGLGEALPEDERVAFERRFNADFSAVRVHRDARAAENADSLGARAFTVGNDISFGAGEYSRELLAHELTHVMQQARIGRQFVQRKEKPSLARKVWFDKDLEHDDFIKLADKQLNLGPGDWHHVKAHYDKSESPVTVWVIAADVTTRRAAGTAAELGLGVDQSDRLEGAAERAEELSGFSRDTRSDLFAEVDRRYWEVLGDRDETKIKDPAKEAGNVALWNQIRDEVLAQREFVMNLSPKVQQVLHYAKGGIIVGPADYEQIVRIAATIQALGDADIENYQRHAKPGRSLNELEAALKRFKAVKEAAQGKIAALMEMTAAGHDDTDTAAAKFDETTLFYLSLADRIALIDEIVHGSFVFDEDEETLIRLLRTTPSADRKALVEKLKSNGGELLDALDDKINLGDNKDLHDAFKNLLVQSMGEADTFAKMENATILPWSDPGLIKGIYTTRYSYSTRITSDGKVAVGYASLFEYRTFLFEPDEIIGLEFQTDDELGAEGKTVYMPAYNLLFMDSEQFKRDLGRALDVALLVAGGVGLVAKGARLAKALAAIEFAVGAAGVVIDSYRPEIASTPAGKEFLRAWDITQALIGIYGITRVVLKAPAAFKKLDEAYRGFKNATTEIDPALLKKIEAPVDDVIHAADKAAIELEIAAVRSKLTPKQSAAFEKELERAAGIEDAAKRRQALTDLESQATSQQSNLELMAELKQAHPDKPPREIAKLATPRIKVPAVPHGLTADEFVEAQALIKGFLQEKGLKDVEGFATGSRVFGITLNPEKKFGTVPLKFPDSDLDITLITPRPLTRSEEAALKKLYEARFHHPLGIVVITDRRQLAYKPIYGKIDLDLK